jgi:Tol biopolymer transport system component
MKRIHPGLNVVVLLLGGQALGSDVVEPPPPGETRLLLNVRQLTYEGRRAGEAYFSPDGRLLIFQSERDKDNPFYQIYVLDLQSGETHRVSPGRGKTTCAYFRPGTEEVLFASTHLDPEAEAKQKKEFEERASGRQRRYAWDYDPAMDLFSARRDGSGLRRLTEAEGYDAEGAYSPDGSKIVFCSTRSAYEAGKLSAEDRKRREIDPAYFGEIYLMDAEGKEVERLTDWPGYDGGPFFTPDGQRIVWRHFQEDGALADVYTMRLDGTDRKRLTDFGAMSWAPYFHPSGRYVLFASNKLGFENFELYLVDAEGQREPVRVTHTEGFDGLPAFSPDGRRLCWTSNRGSDGTSQLFLADWNEAAALAALESAPRRREAGPASAEAGPAPAAGFDPEPRAEELKRTVEFLASDGLEGRMTGSDGAGRAAEWIAQRLGEAGIEPGADGGQMFQEFPFTAGLEVVPEKNRLELHREGKAVQSFEVDKDFRPLSLSTNGEVRGQVVFAGYGLSVPKAEGAAYDSYAGLEVKDKIVLVLRYAPEAVEMKRRQELNRYAGLRYKAMQARERGARALLVVTGPNSPGAGELAKLDFDTSLAGSGIVAASLSGTAAEALLAGTGKELKSLQSELDTENPHAEGGFLIPGVEVRLASALNRIKKVDRNVLGLLRPAGDAAGGEYVVVGAHYDHLGHGEAGNTLARKEEEGQIHNGADDNASGVAAVLELAASLAEERKARPEAFRRGVLFALWSGEELGLVGSSHFAEKPPAAVPIEKVAAYLNFDMVGRLKDNKLIVQGVGSSPAWRPLLEKRNVAAGFQLVLQDDPYLPTDVTALYPKKVPVLAFFTGSHEDYHRPTDDADKLEAAGLERITRLARSLILDLVQSPERPAYAEVKDTRGQGGDRDSLRAYLGTIPDYATEGVEGVKLSGVRGGGPADKAGLQGGDVIVEFAGKKITNIYDYTYALDAVKIGVPVQVVVLRNGQRLEITVTPEARK